VSLNTAVSAAVKCSHFHCLLSASKGICSCHWFTSHLPKCVHWCWSQEL